MAQAQKNSQQLRSELQQAAAAHKHHPLMAVLEAYLTAEAAKLQGQLQQQADPMEIYRAQGGYAALERLQRQLRDLPQP